MWCRLAEQQLELLPHSACTEVLEGLARVRESACRQVLAERVGNQLPLPTFDQYSCAPGPHHQSLSKPALHSAYVLQLYGQVHEHILQACPPQVHRCLCCVAAGAEPRVRCCRCRCRAELQKVSLLPFGVVPHALDVQDAAHLAFQEGFDPCRCSLAGQCSWVPGAQETHRV